MSNQHLIDITPELVQQWLSDFYGSTVAPGEAAIDIANRAAQWGADQELEACCAFVRRGPWCSEKLRAARRPKPPSLKAQALTALDDAVMRGDCITISDALPTLRRALEALND